MARVLYLSIMGMTESLGESQVVQYLLELAKNNSIYLFSFEKPENKIKIPEMKKRLNKANIEWKYYEYSNRFGLFSSCWQILVTFIILGKLIKNQRIELIHARSLISAVIALLLKKKYKVKLLFDIRGFAIDEKIMDGRLKENSFITSFLKKIELLTYRNSDHVVTLTHVSKPIISSLYGTKQEAISVIPTCANQQIFKPINMSEKIMLKERLGFNKEDFIIIQNGSFNASYDFDAQIKLSKELFLLKPNVKLLFLNQGQHAQIAELLQLYKIEKNFYKIIAVDFNQVANYLNISDLAIFFVKPTFAKQASAPTKFAEIVACNLCSVTNKKYGDMEYYFNSYPVGKIFDLEEVNSNPKTTATKVMEFLDRLQQNPILDHFNKLFNENFSKDVAIIKYQKIYSMLVNA